MGRPRVPLERRFAERLPESQTAAGCLEWRGTVAADGYGAIASGGNHSRTLRAHRVSWEIWNGPVPPGLCVLHRCDNRACVNVAHLFLGTVADNNADRSRKGRTNRNGLPRPRGERSATSKISDVERECIRVMAALRVFPQAQIARWFGVSPQLVSLLVWRRP